MLEHLGKIQMRDKTALHMLNIYSLRRKTLPKVGLHVKAPTESASHFVQQTCLIESTLLAALATACISTFKALKAQVLSIMDPKAVLSDTYSFSICDRNGTEL